MQACYAELEPQAKYFPVFFAQYCFFVSITPSCEWNGLCSEDVHRATTGKIASRRVAIPQ